jgi:hypothetical protein
MQKDKTINVIPYFLGGDDDDDDMSKRAIYMLCARVCSKCQVVERRWYCFVHFYSELKAAEQHFDGVGGGASHMLVPSVSGDVRCPLRNDFHYCRTEPFLPKRHAFRQTERFSPN